MFSPRSAGQRRAQRDVGSQGGCVVAGRGGPTGAHLPLLGLGFASTFGVVASSVAARPAPVRDAWIAYLSTNLAKLGDHPVRAVIGSAFVTDDGAVVSWVVLALVGMTAAGEALGNVRLAALLAGGHVLATLVSESVLGAQVHRGAASADARFITDVGPSYVVAPALVLGLLLCPSLVGRLASGLGFALLAPHLFGGSRCVLGRARGRHRSRPARRCGDWRALS